jgi:hypothetical protein
MVKLTTVPSEPKTAGDDARRRETGHYFDQTIFDAHYALQSARARNLALESDLAAMGVTIDPETGIVRIAPLRPKDKDGD